MNTAASRPTRHSKAVLEAAARRLAPSLANTNDPDEGMIQTIARVLEQEAPWFDAYQMTKRLDDDYGWGCNSDTVDACECASSIVNELVRHETVAWVKKCDIRPRQKLGDQVSVTTRDGSGTPGTFTGEIVQIDSDQATYVVMIPALGHVREGLGTYGIRVHYEQLHELATPPEEFELTAG